MRLIASQECRELHAVWDCLEEIVADSANPISHVSPDDPPFLVMHGTIDDLIPEPRDEPYHHDDTAEPDPYDATDEIDIHVPPATGRAEEEVDETGEHRDDRSRPCHRSGAWIRVRRHERYGRRSTATKLSRSVSLFHSELVCVT